MVAIARKNNLLEMYFVGWSDKWKSIHPTTHRLESKYQSGHVQLLATVPSKSVRTLGVDIWSGCNIEQCFLSPPMRYSPSGLR